MCVLFFIYIFLVEQMTLQLGSLGCRFLGELFFSVLAGKKYSQRHLLLKNFLELQIHYRPINTTIVIKNHSVIYVGFRFA